MEKGQIISGIAHAGVILWVVLGDWLFRAETLPEIEVAEVSLMSSAEFDAMMAAAPPPAAEPVEPAAEPEPVEPAPEPEAVEPPEPVQPEEPPPPAEEPPPVAPPEEPLPEDLPQEAVPQPIETPDPVAPIAEIEQPIPVPLSDARPRPRPLDRVAATPVESVDAPEVSDQVIEEVADEPTEEAVIVEEQQEAAAPEEATTQIVTEAVETEEDAPQLEMTSSLRPRSRPAQVAEEPVEEEVAAAAETVEDPADEVTEDAATEDAVAAALAEALAEDSAAEETASEETASAETASDLPVGPPMTAGEQDALRVAVQQCWNVGALSMEALRTTVTVAVSVGQDGVPDAGSITLIDSNGESDTATRQAFEAARRAIIRCGARGFPLPPEKFEQWKNMELVFDPNGMRMR
ncbi:MAG: cell envelope biogenesis protein TolA [Rhodobacteraceae bacterium]|nr:cell envelope biogenesis protein TolA [Paracoccaceae bacterium]